MLLLCFYPSTKFRVIRHALKYPLPYPFNYTNSKWRLSHFWLEPIFMTCILLRNISIQGIYFHSNRLPNYFVFSKIAFSVKNGPFRHIFHVDSTKYRTIFQTLWNVGYLGKKHRNFSYVIKAKCFSFHGLRKMCCFKRATFCIIPRKVKRRCILLIQIFNF